MRKNVLPKNPNTRSTYCVLDFEKSFSILKLVLASWIFSQAIAGFSANKAPTCTKE